MTRPTWPGPAARAQRLGTRSYALAGPGVASLLNIDHIKRAVEQFLGEKSFRNLRINEMVYLFNKTIKNILSNYIPHETITCNDRDPPSINNKIKQLIQEISNTYRNCILSSKNPQIFEKVKYLQNQLKRLTEDNKKRY